MSPEPTKELSAALELLRQWTNIAEADSFEEHGPATIYTTSVSATRKIPADSAIVRKRILGTAMQIQS